MGRLPCIVAAALFAPSCSGEHAGGVDAKPARGPATFIAAPAEGDVTSIVRAQQAASATQGRRAVVVVGAPWCEPCNRLHDAAAQGQLDDVLGGVDLVEFNLDVDRARLEAAGYDSRMIPLIVVPDALGRGTDRRIQGSIKGAGAVEELRPRIADLLAQP